MLTERFDDALVFASRLHRAQTRKGKTVPYVGHLMATAALVLENGGDEDQAIAGLLHDAAEDQGGREILRVIETRFGPAVARIVEDCTDAWIEPKPPWRERKEAYLAALARKPESSLLVSLADKTNNAHDIYVDWREGGEEVWTRFTAGRDGVLWYYRALSDTYSRLLPGPLARELEGYVRALA